MTVRRPSAMLLAVISLVAGLLALAGCGDIFGDHPSGTEASLDFDNMRNETITVSYELEPEQVDPNYPPVPVLTIPPGGSDSFSPWPVAEGVCLVAPIVIRGEDGREIERVPGGYCWDGSPEHGRNFFDIE